jgi:single-strand DNA-binding protein
MLDDPGTLLRQATSWHPVSAGAHHEEVPVNEIHVTIRGNVATEPRTVTFDDGNKVTSFRLASNARRYDVGQRAWVDGGTTYLNVICRRALSENVANSLMVGDPVVVAGRLRERSWEKDGRVGWTMEVDAEGLGHDLAWGVSSFTRINRVQNVTTPGDEQAAVMAAEVEEQYRRQEAVRDVTGFPVLSDEEDDEHGEPAGTDPRRLAAV